MKLLQAKLMLILEVKSIKYYRMFSVSKVITLFQRLAKLRCS